MINLTSPSKSRQVTPNGNESRQHCFVWYFWSLSDNKNTFHCFVPKCRCSVYIFFYRFDCKHACSCLFVWTISVNSESKCTMIFKLTLWKKCVSQIALFFGDFILKRVNLFLLDNSHKEQKVHIHFQKVCRHLFLFVMNSAVTCAFDQMQNKEHTQQHDIGNNYWSTSSTTA